MELLWTDFLNSEWTDWRGGGWSEDRLDKPEWQAAFTERWGLTAPVPAAPADLQALMDLRSLLRRLAGELADDRLTGELAPLNQVMAAGPVVRRIDATEAGIRLALTPVQPGWPQVMAEIVASFAQTLAEGERARVRFCENPDCSWVFYDDTRNRTKRFCEEKTCGNLMKVRRFRARQKAGH